MDGNAQLSQHIRECAEEKRALRDDVHKLEKQLTAQDEILNGILRSVETIADEAKQASSRREKIYSRLGSLEEHKAVVESLDAPALAERLRVAETTIASLQGERAAEGRSRVIIYTACAVALASGIGSLVFAS